MSAELMPRALTATEARSVTDKIRDDVQSLWLHLLEAHDRGVHEALGYSGWGAYCQAEFGWTKGRASQILSAAKVAHMLEFTIVNPTPVRNEGVARELIPVMNSPTELAATWQRAIDSAPRNDAGEPVITAKHVREIVRGPQYAQEAPQKVRAHKEIERPKNDDDRFDDLMAAWIVAPEYVRTRFLNAINGIADDADDGVDPICWGEFVAHRKAIRKPLSSMSAAKNRKVLASLSVADQRRAVDTTIANNWTGIFPPKGNNGAHSQNRPQSAVDRVRAAAAAREAADADY